jgi:hypothetical protein
MKVISLPTTYPERDLHEADVVVSGLAKIVVSVDGASNGAPLLVTLP